MSFGEPDVSQGDGKRIHRLRGEVHWRFDYDGDVEVRFEQPARLDSLLVAAVDEQNAAALEHYGWHVRHGFRCGRAERACHWITLSRRFSRH